LVATSREGVVGPKDEPGFPTQLIDEGRRVGLRVKGQFSFEDVELAVLRDDGMQTLVNT
jgi:hypothetical protein